MVLSVVVSKCVLGLREGTPFEVFNHLAGVFVLLVLLHLLFLLLGWSRDARAVPNILLVCLLCIDGLEEVILKHDGTLEIVMKQRSNYVFVST